MCTHMQSCALTDMPAHAHNSHVVKLKVRNPDLEMKA